MNLLINKITNLLPAYLFAFVNNSKAGDRKKFVNEERTVQNFKPVFLTVTPGIF